MTAPDAPEQIEAEQSLPHGWVRTTLGSISAINQRYTAIRDLADDVLVSFVPMAAVDADAGIVAWKQDRPVVDVRKGYTSFVNGDVLFAKITPCMENGKAAIVSGLSNGWGFGSTEFHVLAPHESVLPEWIFYFVRQQSFRNDAKASFTGTAGQLRVPATFLQKYPVPLPPLAEQRRIVAKIEELFSRLDAGVAALERLRVNLKRYRAAVLKAAVEGKLTAEWRTQYPDVEPASALLQRILRERRAAWENAELERFARVGKEPPKGWREKYKEPDGPVTDGLPVLPKSWCWAIPKALANATNHALAIGPFGSDLKVEDYRFEGVPLIFVRNIRSGIFSGLGTRFITPQKAEQLRAHKVSAGDILITKMGDPPGDSCLYPDGYPSAVITADCIKWTLLPILHEPRYFVHAVNSPVIKSLVVNITKGVAQLKVSLGRFEQIPFPLPPLAEQTQIVAEVEQRLSVATEVERLIEVEMKRAARLRQSILKRAFAGKLVSQDPTDEPASVSVADQRNGVPDRSPQLAPMPIFDSTSSNGYRQDIVQLRMFDEED